MRKYLLIFLTIISSTIFVSCETEDEFTPPNYVTFEAEELAIQVNEESNESIEVTVYTANKTGSDRTFDLVVEENSTINSDSYIIPESIVIPANTNEATFTIEVTDNSLSDAGDLLVLSLASDKDVFTGEPLTVEITKICEFTPTGYFINNSEWFGEAYNLVLEAGAEPGTYIVKDMFTIGVDISFTVNEDYTVTVPKQFAWVHPTYGDAYVTGKAGSKIEPCLEKVTLALEHTVAAGSFGTFAEVLTPTAPPTEEEGSDEDGTGGTEE